MMNRTLIRKAYWGEERNGCDWREDFFNRNVALVYNLILRAVKDHYYAEDLTQDTFIRFFQNCHSIHTSEAGYLKAIAARLSIDFLRKKGRETPVYEHKDISDSRAEVAGIIINMECASRLTGALKGLDDYTRSFIVTLSEGFKLRDLSLIFNVTTSKIRSDSVRCRRKAIQALCSEKDMKSCFNEEETDFIDCYTHPYWSKKKVRDSKKLTDSDFTKIQKSVFTKIYCFYSPQ
ncbi:MAG: RNA polymerase sigma factor [Candidatus Xenobiia bacterium LiM19]